jgi:hypothetical protein
LLSVLLAPTLGPNAAEDMAAVSTGAAVVVSMEVASTAAEGFTVATAVAALAAVMVEVVSAAATAVIEVVMVAGVVGADGAVGDRAGDMALV